MPTGSSQSSSPAMSRTSAFCHTLSQLTVCTGPTMSEWSSSVASRTAARLAAMSSGRSISNGVSISNDGVGMPWEEKCRSTFIVFVWMQLASSTILLEVMVTYLGNGLQQNHFPLEPCLFCLPTLTRVWERDDDREVRTWKHKASLNNPAGQLLLSLAFLLRVQSTLHKEAPHM